MKTKFTLLFALLFIGLNSAFAQNNEACKTKLSLFHGSVIAKNYDDAYKPWMYVRKHCPDMHIAIYTEGKDILEYKIEQASETDKVKYINDLLKLWKERAMHFPEKTKIGHYAAMACQLNYDHRSLLNKTNTELYTCFDETFKEDRNTFTNPKSLYTYFSLMVNLYDDKKTVAQDLFNTYDDISEKIEVEVKNYAEKLNVLIAKKDNGQILTRKELIYKKHYENYLKSYGQISASMVAKLDPRINCENLIPLYESSFQSHKSDSVWLKRAVSKMYHKKCTDVALYETLVKAYDETAPSADTKYFVATILFKNGKDLEGENYLKQAFDLESDPYKKGERAHQIGKALKNRKKFSKARTYFRKALKLNPSNGNPHLSIAAMYDSSAKNCGDSNFNKRAVYWLAAKEAQKASRVDPTLKKKAVQSTESYRAKAPTKEEIFISGKAGEILKIGCWIQSSVKVPSIKKTPVVKN